MAYQQNNFWRNDHHGDDYAISLDALKMPAVERLFLNTLVLTSTLYSEYGGNRELNNKAASCEAALLSF
jgi:hypothetical protein